MSQQSENSIANAPIAHRFRGKMFEAISPKHRAVLEQISRGEPISRDPLEAAEDHATMWDRLADRVAAVGGSWTFIFTFLALLLAWMLLNTNVLNHWSLTFDPYPYIFLNLMLSLVAALQAPVIMMSQNRQSAKDRLAARHDYEVNLKAELEIMALHEKLDSLRIEHLEMLVRQQSEILSLLKSRFDKAAIP